MRLASSVVLALLLPAALAAQGKFPPDSLVNTQVLAHATPVPQLLGTMRSFATSLGVRCQFCHIGEEGQPLDRFDFVSDQKRTKQVARQMMRMVAEINARLDTLPGRAASGAPQVTCLTCHRGTNRPVPLATLIGDAAIGAGADSAARAYRALRARYYGRDAFDFGDASLNTAAMRVARAGKIDEALVLLRLNEEANPGAASPAVTRGAVTLLRGDTTGAIAAYREALRRDSTSAEARTRLRELGQRP